MMKKSCAMKPGKPFTVLAYLLILSANLHNELEAQLALEPFATGLKNPVSMAHAGDSRLFVAEQTGIIRILDSTGIIQGEPFLNMESKVRSGGELGLLGLAFHPDYGNNGYFYVNYTADGPRTVISRFSVSFNDPDRADPESELEILSFDQPYDNHNGGDIRFGPDGYLYIATGDGGSGGDPQNQAQDLTSWLGKILRIDVDSGNPYSIPGDNPFFNVDSALGEVWAYGLRNPWRFSFDRQTGDLWIADVGQNKLEEINFQPASGNGGDNYGWRCYEGSQAYNFAACSDQDNYVFPVYEIDHNLTGACSVTGGFVYRGSTFPSLAGQYIFTDYCSGQFWSLRDSAGTWVAADLGTFPGHWISTFGEDHHGELYAAALSGGTLFRIIGTGTTSAGINSPQALFRLYPNPAGSFLVVESGNPDQQIQGVRIYDAGGRLLLSRSVPGDRLELSLDRLSPGIYFMEATVDGKSEVVKFSRQ